MCHPSNWKCPHFLKDQGAILTGRLRQESRTQEHRVGSDAAFVFPVGVKLFWPSFIQLFHHSWRRSSNGLFRETSLAKPPGITAMSVFAWRTAHFTESRRWAWKESQMRRLFFLRRLPGRDRHTFSAHSFISASSILPFGWHCTRTPGGKFSFGKVFRLKNTMGFSLVSVSHTCKYDSERRFLMSSCVDQHSFCTSLIRGSGWWHVKPDRHFFPLPDVNKFVIFLPSTLDYEAVIFCSRCSRSFRAIFVFCWRGRFFRQGNLVHQQLEARNLVICNSEAIAFALMLSMNSRPAAQLFGSCANLTTCSLKLAEYFIRF